MSNSEAIDPDGNSDSDSFYSPTNSAKTSDEQNTKKRPRHKNSSNSSDSPSPTVQNRIVKVIKQGDLDTSTFSSNKMDEAMKTFFKDLVLKSEERIKSEISDIRQDFVNFRSEVFQKISVINAQVQSLKLELKSVATQIRKKNLIIQGLPEKKDETWMDLEKSVTELYEKLGISVKPDYDDCFRLGKPQLGKVRPIILKLIRLKDKKMILSQTKKLKGTNIYVNEDHDKDDRRKLSILRAKERELRKDNPEAQVYIRGQTLIFKKGSTSQFFNVNETMQVKERTQSSLDMGMIH
jgi:hypothetical protein